jgi:putative oligomerization/nucleic acid binding protein/phospholipase D-like protein
VVVASNYPFLDVFWDIVIFFCFFIWIWLLFTIFADLFRRHDLSGWGKAAWIVFVIILPFLGVFVYIIAEHQGMADRSARQAQQAQAQLDDYVQSVASQGDPASQIANAKKLLDSGAISQVEFDRLKAKALA